MDYARFQRLETLYENLLTMLASLRIAIENWERDEQNEVAYPMRSWYRQVMREAQFASDRILFCLRYAGLDMDEVERAIAERVERFKEERIDRVA